MKEILKFLEEIVFPPDIKCIICGNELIEKNKYSICEHCHLNYITKYCCKCGIAMNNEAMYCNFCMNNSREFEQAFSAVVYDDTSKKLVQGLKFGGKKYIANYMARLMIDIYYNNYDILSQIDFITFVPMTNNSIRKRGFNQANLLAECISQNVGKKVLNVLKKIKDTEELAKLNYKERREKIKNAFVLNEKFSKNSTILLVDDVFTTGSTTEECASVLKKYGGAVTYVLTFANGKSFDRKQ